MLARACACVEVHPLPRLITSATQVLVAHGILLQIDVLWSNIPHFNVYPCATAQRTSAKKKGGICEQSYSSGGQFGAVNLPRGQIRSPPFNVAHFL